MKEIKSIRALPDGGYDVLFDEDGKARYACQVYDRKEPNHFTWAEVQAALPAKLDADPGPAPDPRTDEEKKADRKEEILSRLKALDADIPRVVEDLIDVVSADMYDRGKLFVLDAKKQAIKDEKVALRNELKAL